MDPAYTATHLEEDRNHWWFRGRRVIVLAVLQRLLTPGGHRLLDLGCGSGNVLETLGRFGEAVGMEADESLAAAARAAGLDVRRGALPDDRVVPVGWPDVVLLLDVLEHVDDGAALRSAHALLPPGGLLVATVPAYQWLWSAHDVALGHRRRYTATQLRAAVRAAGFTIVSLSYFNTLLLPGVALVRALKRLRGVEHHDLVRPSARVNGLLAGVFSLEAAVIPRCPLPCGTSLIVVGRR